MSELTNTTPEACRVPPSRQASRREPTVTAMVHQRLFASDLMSKPLSLAHLLACYRDRELTLTPRELAARLFNAGYIQQIRVTDLLNRHGVTPRYVKVRGQARFERQVSKRKLQFIVKQRELNGLSNEERLKHQQQTEQHTYGRSLT